MGQVIREDAFEAIKPVASIIETEILPLLSKMQENLHTVANETGITGFIKAVDEGDAVVQAVLKSGEPLMESFNQICNYYEDLQNA